MYTALLFRYINNNTLNMHLKQLKDFRLNASECPDVGIQSVCFVCFRSFELMTSFTIHTHLIFYLVLFIQGFHPRRLLCTSLKTQ